MGAHPSPPPSHLTLTLTHGVASGPGHVVFPGEMGQQSTNPHRLPLGRRDKKGKGDKRVRERQGSRRWEGQAAFRLPQARPHHPIPHRLSLRLFLRWGLDWPLCGEETSFFRSLVGEGGPVPLPILVWRKKQRHTKGFPESLLPEAALFPRGHPKPVS